MNKNYNVISGSLNLTIVKQYFVGVHVLHATPPWTCLFQKCRSGEGDDQRGGNWSRFAHLTSACHLVRGASLDQ